MKRTSIISLISYVTITTVLGYITMCVLMRFLPLRQLMGFASESITWGLPQGIEFGVADFIYSRLAKAASVIIGLCAGLMLTFLDINGKTWWIAFGCLFFVFVVGTLIILHQTSDGWDSLYGQYFLDVLLCPLFLLGEIEMMVYLVRKGKRHLLFKRTARIQ